MKRILAIIAGLSIAVWMATGVNRQTHELTLLFWDTGYEVNLPWAAIFGASPPGRIAGGMFLFAGLAKVYGWARAIRKPGPLPSNAKPAVLYLRDFRVDEKPRPIKYTHDWMADPDSVETFDQHVCGHFRGAGRISAIVRNLPGAITPVGPDGIFLLAEQDWQNEVTQLMQRARLILLVLGTSPGLIWELETALRLVPERLVLLAPAESVTPSIWEVAHRRLTAAGIEAPKDAPINARLFRIEDKKLVAHAGEYALYEGARSIVRNAKKIADDLIDHR
jgi:hypothetical protein